MAGYDLVDVVDQPPQSGDKAQIRSINVNLKWNTRKILMLKAGVGFIFSLSEVQFFTCNSE